MPLYTRLAVEKYDDMDGITVRHTIPRLQEHDEFGSYQSPVHSEAEDVGSYGQLIPPNM